jgi:hypothetical protein
MLVISFKDNNGLHRVTPNIITFSQVSPVRNQGSWLMKQLFLIAIFSILSFSLAAAVANAQSQSSQQAIESISVVTGDGDQEQLIVELNGSYTPYVFRLDGERPRLVFDFPETIYRGEKSRIEDTGGRIIGGVRVGKHTKPVKTRVVVDIVANVDYQYEKSFNVSTNSLVVTFYRNADGVPDKQTVAAAGPRYLRVESKKIVHLPQPPEAPASPPPRPPVDPQKEPEPVLNATTEAPQVSQPAVEPEPLPAVPIAEPVAAATAPPASNATQQQIPTEVQVPSAAEPKAAESAETAAAADSADVSDTADSAAPAETVATLTRPDAEAPPVLLDVAFERSINKSETVLFRLNNFFPPLVFGIEQGEPQVVCDFLDATLGPEVADSIQADGDYISRVDVLSQSDPDKVRVTLSLVPNRHYDLQQLFFKEDNLFVIIVSEFQEAAASGAN